MIEQENEKREEMQSKIFNGKINRAFSIRLHNGLLTMLGFRLLRNPSNGYLECLEKLGETLNAYKTERDEHNKQTVSVSTVFTQRAH